jgi:hypothetical protein
MLVSGCGPGQLFGPTVTPTATATPTSTLTPTPKPTATLTSTPKTTLDGTWTGTTSQEKPISFRVAGNSIEFLELGYTVEGANCTVGTETKFGPGLLCLITENKFSLEIPGLNGQNYFVMGSFNDFNSASGDLQISGQDFLCGKFTVSATWTTRKG